MNIVIFAGGVGTRLWPLSRKKSPKQFERVVGDRSTLQLSLDRLLPTFSPKNVFISTNTKYIDAVRKQLKDVPDSNVIGEPEMRDVGPAVGLLTAILAVEAPNTPMAILWSDHLVKQEELFRSILKSAEKVIKKDPNKIVFIAQKPRFASENLGWIEFGNEKKRQGKISLHAFSGFKYQPDKKTADKYFKSGKHAWNLGYFVTTPSFLMKKYKILAPDMYKTLSEISKHWKKISWNKTLKKLYPTLEKISFDNAILEKLSHDEAYVISDDLEWSDVGAWEALKEALQDVEGANVTHGSTITKDVSDSLVYNYNDGQLLITIDVDGLLVVNTEDVTLVCRKDSAAKLKKLVKSFDGTEHEHLT